MEKTLLVIIGPTAIGKTALSISLAQHYRTELISADARQFYREMNIGTAKPSIEELQMVKHHFINNKSIHDLYSAGEFERDALVTLTDLFQRHDLVIAVGGSGLYIKALCEGLDAMADADLGLRKELILLFEKEGINALEMRLKQIAPERWSTIDQRNPQRLMRAIEMANQSTLYSPLKALRPFKILKLGLKMNRQLLYQRINIRVNKMMDAGLANETRSLYTYRQLNALQTVGYNELFNYIENKIPIEKAVELIKQHTRNYAKRQITWFNKDNNVNWFDPDDFTPITQWLDDMIMAS